MVVWWCVYRIKFEAKTQQHFYLSCVQGSGWLLCKSWSLLLPLSWYLRRVTEQFTCRQNALLEFSDPLIMWVSRSITHF